LLIKIKSLKENRHSSNKLLNLIGGFPTLRRRC